MNGKTEMRRKMEKPLALQINGQEVLVPSGVTVAVALALAGLDASRRSVTGQPRGPLCGMGICFECRVSIDQVPDRLGCQTLCRSGMTIQTCCG